MTFINIFKGTAIVFAILFLYLVFTLALPLVYSRYLYKTEPPTNLVNIDLPQDLNSGEMANNKTLKIAVIGDSTALGQGTESVKQSFSYQYAQKYLTPKYNQINYSNFAITGSTIEQLLDRQIGNLDNQNFDLIFVSIGSNDVISTKIDNSLYSQNIQKLLEKLQTTKAKIIWLSIPDFITSPVLLPPLSTYLSNRARDLNQETRQVLDKANLKLVDVFDRTRQPFIDDANKYFSKDKYHPSLDGYSTWAESIYTEFGDLEI